MRSARSGGRSLSRWVGLVLVGLLATGLTLPATAQRFLPDDPLWSDPDRMDMPFPEPHPDDARSGPVEFVRRMFTFSEGPLTPAVNVNTVEGVPNSSWYTNRHYHAPMSVDELRRGPNRTPGPSEGPWRVETFRDGRLPGATVQDSTGRRFRLLMDAKAHPELATGAAMVGSRLLYALGYNVPQYWLRSVDRDRLIPGADTTVTAAEIDSVLARAPRQGEDTYRVLVSRIPNVERRIGPFSFRGSREDDANDVFPHQHRRELRALRVVAAWIHHSMIRPRHTLDVGVREGSRQFVRHYLTDLHLALGSAGAEPKPRWSGHEHLLELDQVVQRIATVGLSGGDWAGTVVPDWPGVGHFESSGFVPRTWRPEWPNPAFRQMTPADAFWAAKKIRNVSRADLAAVVEAADYSSAATRNYMIQTLLLRRNAIGRAYLPWGGGLDRFRVRHGELHFRDVLVHHGYIPASPRRTVTWHVFHNRENRVGRRITHSQTRGDSIPIPATRAAFLRARVHTGPQEATYVFLRRTISQTASLPPMHMPYEVVGIERVGPNDD